MADFRWEGNTYVVLDPSIDWHDYFENIGHPNPSRWPRGEWPNTTPALMHAIVQGNGFAVWAERSSLGETSGESTLNAAAEWLLENEPDSLTPDAELWAEAIAEAGTEDDEGLIQEVFEELNDDLTYTPSGWLDDWHSLHDVAPYSPFWNMALVQILDSSPPQWREDTWYDLWLDLQRAEVPSEDEDLSELEDADDFIYAMGILVPQDSPLGEEAVLEELTERQEDDLLPSWYVQDDEFETKLIVFCVEDVEGLLVLQDYVLEQGLEPRFVFPAVEGYTVPQALPLGERILRPLETKLKNRLLR